MKKSLAILAFAATAFVTSYAQTTVSSANIVGYVQTQTPAEGAYNIISLVQFSDGTDSVNIQDAIANLDALNSSATWDAADKIYIWNGANYAKYGLFQPATGSPYWSAYGLAWAGGSPAVADVQLYRGAAVWYATGTGGVATNVTISGDVYLDDTYEVAVPEGLSILAYPYSSSINLTNLVISNATAAATWNNADKIYIFNGSNYSKYGLFQPASGDPYWSAYGLAWAGGSPAVANVELNLGQGFWYESDTAKTIGFGKIYSIE
jgi:hypothetical protein